MAAQTRAAENASVAVSRSTTTCRGPRGCHLPYGASNITTVGVCVAEERWAAPPSGREKKGRPLEQGGEFERAGRGDRAHAAPRKAAGESLGHGAVVRHADDRPRPAPSHRANGERRRRKSSARKRTGRFELRLIRPKDADPANGGRASAARANCSAGPGKCRRNMSCSKRGAGMSSGPSSRSCVSTWCSRCAFCGSATGCV